MSYCTNHQSLSRIIQENRLRLLSIARHRGLIGEDALDCVQNAFVTFLQHPNLEHLIEHPEESAKLLTTLTQYAARSERRLVDKHRRPGDAPENEPASAEQQVAQEEERSSLQQCILSLRENQRAIVILRFFEDVSGQEVAAQLGMSPEHVAVLLHRAKESLRGCMMAAGHNSMSP
jgi:RNA polymerase sigma-70 factor (ECF subfamily)